MALPIIETGRTFEIYSIGDGLFMRRIIDSVAAMNNAGVLLDLLALSLMIGLLVMAFRNVVAGGNKLDLGSMLVSLILGVAMFGMKATVVIHDMNFAPGEIDQPSYVVDNVPFGIAAAGYIISGVGYELTLQMEQGYGLYTGGRSSLIEGGFGNTLEWINQLRAWENPMFGDVASGGASRFRTNMMSYMESCVAPGIEMGHLNLDTILHTPNIWTMGNPSGGGIGYSSVWLTASYVDSSNNRTVLPCADVFARLDTDRGAVFPAYADALAKTQLDKSSSGMDVQTALSEAYNAIGINSSKMQDLVVAEVVGMTLETAVSGSDSSALGAQSKMMIEQASMQRSVQWAAEETMFRRIMRPMMAFFESLMYALAPFMALMLGLGSYGIQTVGKYLMLSIWVALWMPMLSIIELYQVTMMQHAVTAMMYGIDHGQTGGVTIATANALRTQSIEWLSTGAAMAAFTPAITMALVWGGAITASALASRLRGSDTVNERQVVPDTAGVSPSVGVGAGSDFTRAKGSQLGGSAGSNPVINMSEASSSLMASASSRMSATRAELQAAYDHVRTETLGASRSVAANSSVTDAGSSSATDVGSASRGTSVTSGSDSRVDKSIVSSDSNQVSQTVGANGNVGLGGGSLPGGGVSASGQNHEAHRTDKTGRLAEGTSQGASETSSVNRGNNFASGQTHGEQTGLSASDQKKLDQALSNSTRYQRALAASQSAQESYQEVSQMSAQWGMSQSVDVAQLAHQMASKNPAAAANVGALVSAAGYGSELVKANEARVSPILSGSERTLAAQIMTLHQGAMEGTTRGADAATASFRREAFAEAMTGSQLPAQVFSGSLRPDSNSSVAGNVPSASQVEGMTAGATGASFSGSDLQAGVHGALAGDKSVLHAMESNANRPVGANPENFGSYSASRGMTAGTSAEAAGAPMIAEVDQHGKAAAGEASRGFAAGAYSGIAEMTNLDGHGRMVMNSFLPEAMVGDNADELADMNKATMQDHPWMEWRAANMLNVSKMLESHGPTAVPHASFGAAMAYMNTEEGGAMMDTYGDKMAGEARLQESDRRVESGVEGVGGQPLHTRLMEQRAAAASEAELRKEIGLD